jgi:hypothetical protein
MARPRFADLPRFSARLKKLSRHAQACPGGAKRRESVALRVGPVTGPPPEGDLQRSAFKAPRVGQCTSGPREGCGISGTTGAATMALSLIAQGTPTRCAGLIARSPW